MEMERVIIKEIPKARLLGNLFIHGKTVSRAKLGTWNFFIPRLSLKLPFTAHSRTICRHKSAPGFDQLLHTDTSAVNTGQYSIDEWRNAFSKNSRLRAVENYICAKRLHQHGLGPKPFGFAVIRNFQHRYYPLAGECVGLIVDNVFHLPMKKQTTEQEILQAGVSIDKIRSCVRQQVNGYVIDLNSVVGCMPVDAENEIAQLSKSLDELLSKSYGQDRSYYQEHLLDVI